jgi:nicotinamidase-related amidase
VLVIDLANYWLDPKKQIGSNLSSVVEATCQILRAARAAKIPILFTSFAHDPAFPPSPHDRKLKMKFPADPGDLFELDARLERRPTELIVKKRFASAFKGTPLYEILAGLGTDTLIVTGVSTSHCVYATCRDATHHFRVIVPREAVGERCELMHEVFLLDIDIDLADVTPVAQVVEYLQKSLAAL